MVRKLRKLLLALSGARSEVLVHCPSEQIKFESLGWAILITSGMATVSMWFALSSAMGINPFAAILPALAWGLIIMGIDRWLVTSMPPDGSRRLVMALPRLALAVLLGTLISTPLVLRIFQSEINAQITVIKQERASAFLTQQAHSQVGQQVTYWTNDVSNLEKVIDSGGQVALNPSADPVVQGLTAQRTKEIALEQQYYHQWQCQLYGGPGCPPGDGPLAQASENSYNQAKAQVATLTNDIQARENKLSATDSASEKARYDQANAALPSAQLQLKAAVARENVLQANFDAQNEATNGLLIRLQALSQLSDNDFSVTVARFLLFLLFLVIECLPVTVKLLQQPGHYEEIVKLEHQRELENAERAFRYRPGTGTASAFADADRPPDPGMNVREIWQPTLAMPPRGNTDAAEHVSADEIWRHFPYPGETESEAADDTGEITPLADRALRGMTDQRVSATSDGHGGGIPLNFDDDDL